MFLPLCPQVKEEEDPYGDGKLKQHVARVAYEKSQDFVHRPKEVPLPPDLAQVCERGMMNDLVLLVAPNEGLRQSLERLLR